MKKLIICVMIATAVLFGSVFFGCDNADHDGVVDTPIPDEKIDTPMIPLSIRKTI